MHTLSSELVLRAAARRMGISYEEYIAHRKAGEARCVGPCKRWFMGQASGFECPACKSLRNSNRKPPKPKLTPIAFISDPERVDEPKSPAPDAWERPDFTPTKLPPGASKVDLLAWRYEHGLPLWHDDDALHGKSEAELAGNNPIIGEGRYAED